MKRPIIYIAAGLGVIVAAALAFAQTGTPSSTSSTAQKNQKFVPIATIKGAQAVQEFEHNVQVMQGERQQVIDLKAALDKETNAAKKKELKTKLDTATAKIEKDNAAMTKAYGFSLARNYTAEINELTIYMAVSEEEAAKIEAVQKAKK